nr:hypothetical protein [Tanacetum cinerariifolium]
DQSNLADLNDNLVDSMPEMFTKEHALDYSSSPLYDEYDDDLFEVESNSENVYDDPFDSKVEKIKESKLLIDELDLPCDFLLPSEYESFFSKDFSEVDALPSTNNKDKIFKPEEVPTASEESSHCQKKRESTAVKIALILKSRRNCQSNSDDSYAKDYSMQQSPCLTRQKILSQFHQVVSKLGKFEQWQFRIQQYLQHEHYGLWEVIEFGDSYVVPASAASAKTTDTASDGTGKKREGQLH